MNHSSEKRFNFYLRNARKERLPRHQWRVQYPNIWSHKQGLPLPGPGPMWYWERKQRSLLQNIWVLSRCAHSLQTVQLTSRQAENSGRTWGKPVMLHTGRFHCLHIEHLYFLTPVFQTLFVSLKICHATNTQKSLSSQWASFRERILCLESGSV